MFQVIVQYQDTTATCLLPFSWKSYCHWIIWIFLSLYCNFLYFKPLGLLSRLIKMTNLTNFIQNISCVDVKTVWVNFVSKQCCILVFIFYTCVLKVAVLRIYYMKQFTDVYQIYVVTYILSLHTYNMLMEFITGIRSVHYSLAGIIPNNCAYCAACVSTL